MSRYIFIFLLLLICSCHKDEKFNDEQLTAVSVSLRSSNGQIAVPGGSSYTRSVDYVMVPVQIVLSAAAPKIFTVDIGVNNDTVTQLINSQQLPGAILLDEAFYQLPRSAEIRFGIDTFTIPLQVSMQAIEKYYGSKLALAVTLSNPGKSNTLDAGGATAIVVLNTSEIIRPEDIHYLSFTEAGKIWPVPSGTDHILGTTEVTIPVSVTLGGVAGGAFSINLAAFPDTAQAMIDNGTLNNAVLLKEGDDYSLPASLSFPAGVNAAKFNLVVKTSSLQKYAAKKPVLALQLNDPTKHLLDSSKRVLVMALDPSKLIETDITNTNIGYKTQYENTSNANEVSAKLIDNNINTKFLLFNFSTVWVQLEFATPQTTGAYTMTSANDGPNRDPKNWTIEGSDNGSDWTVLDTRNNQTFGSRFLTVKYTFSNQVAFKFYRLNVSAVGSGTLFQLAEWRLLKRP